MRIGVLNNLRAGKSRPEVGRILGVLSDYPDVLHVETDNVRAVPEALATLARQNVELLVVNGGDGTLQYALTRMLTIEEFRDLPMVAPLRGGRTNMSARDIGSFRDPVKGLRGLLEDARSGQLGRRTVQRPVLRVETLRNRHVNYGFFFGAGMIHRAIALTHELFPNGKSQGVLGAGLVTAGLIARAATNRLDGVMVPDKAQIVLDDSVVDRGEFKLIIASSLQRLFLKMNPFWGVRDAPVRFTAIASNSHRTAVAAPGILRGKPASFVRSENGYTSENVDAAELSVGCGFTVDGEVVPPREDEVIRIGGDTRVTFVRA